MGRHRGQTAQQGQHGPMLRTLLYNYQVSEWSPVTIFFIPPTSLRSRFRPLKVARSRAERSKGHVGTVCSQCKSVLQPIDQPCPASCNSVNMTRSGAAAAHVTFRALGASAAAAASSPCCRRGLLQHALAPAVTDQSSADFAVPSAGEAWWLRLASQKPSTG